MPNSRGRYRGPSAVLSAYSPGSANQAGTTVPNIAALLKQEITRLSRKELRAAITPLKKQIASLRHEVATLKKERAELHRTVSGLAKASRTGPATKKADVPDGEAGGGIS